MLQKKEMTKKMLTAEIIKLLPDKMDYQQRYQYFLELADIYKKKAAKEIQQENNEFKRKLK